MYDTTLPAMALVIGLTSNSLTLHSPAAQSRGWFGAAVALDGGTLVVGAPLEDVHGDGDGAVHVFERLGDEWCATARVSGPGADHSWFGRALALDGDRLVVAAPNVREVHVMQRTLAGWSVDAVLPDPGQGGDSGFGHEVAVSGDRIAVGSPREQGVGVVRVYERVGDDWHLDATLSDERPSRFFGSDLALGEDRLVVGAPGEPDDGDRGVVVVFERGPGGWTTTARVAAPEGESAFGSTVSAVGDVVVVGAPYAGDASGAVYALAAGGPSRIGRGAAGERLGDALALWRHAGTLHLAAGALRAAGPQGAEAVGAVDRWRRTSSGWRRRSRITAPQPQTASYFGMSVDGDGGVLAIGAPFTDTDAGDDAGVVVLVEDPGPRHVP